MFGNRLAAMAALVVFGAASANAFWVKIADFDGTVDTFGPTPSNPLVFSGQLVPDPLVASYVNTLFSQNLNNFQFNASVSLNPDFTLDSGTWNIQHISNPLWKPVLGQVTSFSYVQTGSTATAKVLLGSNGNLYDPAGNIAYTMNSLSFGGIRPSGNFKVEGIFNDASDGFRGSLYAEAVPEPATMALAAAGLAIAARRRRKA